MQLIIMTKNQLKLLFRNRIAIMITIFVPLMLTYLFSFSQSSSEKYNLYVYDGDKSVYSEELITMIKNIKNINVINSSESEIKKKVNNQEISIGFVINKGFERSLSENTINAEIIQNYDTGEGAVLEEIINNEVSLLKKIIIDSKYISDESNSTSINISSAILQDMNKPSMITIADETPGNKNVQNTATVRLIGFLVMFLWFVIIQGLRTLIDEQEGNTYKRLLSTPINYNKYLISKLIATYSLGVIHVIAILVIGKYLLNVNIVNNLLTVSVIFAAYLLALISITMIFVPFIKNQQQFTISSAIIIAVTGILGGSFFPLELAPKFVQTISKITPEFWAIKSLNDAIFNGSSIASQLIPLTVFISIGIIGLLLSVIIVNIKIKFEKS